MPPQRVTVAPAKGRWRVDGPKRDGNGARFRTKQQAVRAGASQGRHMGTPSWIIKGRDSRPRPSAPTAPIRALPKSESV